MKFSRRDFIHAGCTAGAAALVASPIDKAKAFLHRGGSGGIVPITGKNQVGLNGFAYYTNIKQTTNWFHSAQLEQLNLTGAVASITQTAGTATITTPVSHGFWSGTITAGWNLSIAGANQAGYNLSGAIFTITGPTTITYPVNSGTVSPATGTITYVVILFSSGSFPANSPNSSLGVGNNPTQYFTADGLPQANIANAISIQCRWIYQTLNGTSYLPAGYTRAGQQMLCAWTGATAGSLTNSLNTWTNSTQSASSAWVSSMDTGNTELLFNIPNPADPPTSIYLGLSDGTGNPATDNYAAWLAGTDIDPAYIAQLGASAGVVRMMDVMNTNGNYTTIFKYTNIATRNTQAWASTRGVPVSFITEVANRANKHPWVNIPWDLGQKCYVPITGISQSNPAVVTTGTVAHPFVPGDFVIGNTISGTGGGSGGGMGLSSAVTFDVPSSTVTWTGHPFAAGQPVMFTVGTRPTNVGNVTTYWVTNVGVNTFQLAISYANAIAGTNFAFTGSNGSSTGSSQISRTLFKVGTTTANTFQLLGCDSTNFGSGATSGTFVQQFSLAGMTTEITNFITAIKNGLTNPNVVPKFAFGNEMWNTIFGGFAWNSSQCRCFTNPTTAAQFLGNDDNNRMQGYLAAHAMKTVRDVYGTSSGTGWEGVLESQSTNSTVTNGMLAGVDFYLTNVLGNSLTRNDLFSAIAITGYYGGLMQTNGTGGNFSGVTIATTSPATVTLATGTNSLPVGAPVIFTTSGTLPNDLATGLPLVLGDMSASISGISGYFSGTTFTVTAITGTPLTVGMTVWPRLAPTIGAYNGNNMTYSGVQPAIIQSFGTGVGGLGTYNMSVSQTAGSVGSPLTAMQAMDTNKNCQVYYTTSTGNTFTFSATQGGANINCDPANPGSGTHNCLKGVATQLCVWMNQSVSLNASTPVTYPSRYSYWNTTLNSEIQTQQFTKITNFGQPTWVNHVTYAVTTGAMMPSPLKMFQYEGGQSDEPQGNAPNGAIMTNNPMFQEFWPQAIGTAEDGANWTWMVGKWAGLSAFAVAQGVPNAANLVTQWPSKFTDGINLSYNFGFGGLTIIDHLQGIGFPNWQNQSMNSHVLYDAVVATN